MSKQLWLVMQGSCAVEMLDAPSVLIMPISATIIRNIQHAHSLIDGLEKVIAGFCALELDVNATYYSFERDGDEAAVQSEDLEVLLEDLSWFIVADLPTDEEHGLGEVSVPFLKRVRSGGDHIVISRHGLGWSAFEHYNGDALSDIGGPGIKDLPELLDICESGKWPLDNSHCREALV